MGQAIAIEKTGYFVTDPLPVRQAPDSTVLALTDATGRVRSARFVQSGMPAIQTSNRGSYVLIGYSRIAIANTSQGGRWGLRA